MFYLSMAYLEDVCTSGFPHPGWWFNRQKNRPKTRPKPHFEKETCMNFKIWDFLIILFQAYFGPILGLIFGRIFGRIFFSIELPPRWPVTRPSGRAVGIPKAKSAKNDRNLLYYICQESIHICQGRFVCPSRPITWNQCFVEQKCINISWQA